MMYNGQEGNDHMSTRNYNVKDLLVLTELSDQSFLCFSNDENWELIWHSDALIKEIDHQDLNLDTLRKQCKRIYVNHEAFIVLYDQKNHEFRYRTSYEIILFEGQSCILFKFTWINDALMDDEIVKINRLRTNSVPCGILCVRIEQETLHCVYHNTYIYKMLGYQETELKQDDILSTRIIYAEDFSNFKTELLTHIKDHDSVFDLEYRVRKKDGTLRWMVARVVSDVLKNHYLAIVLDNTTRKEMMNQLRISEEEKRIALHQGSLSILRYDVKSKILSITDDGAETKENGRRVENMPDIAIEKNIISEDTINEFLNFYQDMKLGKASGEAIFRQMILPLKEMRWIKARYTMLYDEQSLPETAIISYEDYTDIHEKEMAFENWKVEFDQKKNETIAYYEYDLTRDRFDSVEGRVADVLPQAVRKSFTYIAHYSADHFVSLKDRKKYLKIFSQDFLLAQYEKGKRVITLKHRRYDEHGKEYWALGEIRLILDPYTNDVKASVLIYDIDKEMNRTIELRKLSQTDALTGLYNRSALFHKMENTLKHSGLQVMHVMILIDLDDFKILNDTYGHQCGDTCLIKVAKAIQNVCRTDDICSRIGGDEFVIFIRNMSLHADIDTKLDDILRAIQGLDAFGKPLSASIGAARYPMDGQEVSTLYHCADEAMYQAKRLNGNQYRIFCKKMGELVDEQSEK